MPTPATRPSLSHQTYFRYVESFLKARFRPAEASAAGLADEALLTAHLAACFPGMEVGENETFLLALTLIPHLDSAYYDMVLLDLLGEGNAPQLGGVRGVQHRGILPTGEMFLFLLAGKDVDRRVILQQQYLGGAHWLFREKVLTLEPPLPGEPRQSGKLLLADEYVDLLLTGRLGKPAFSMDFPAQRIVSGQEWADLVLHPATEQQVRSLENWLAHGKSLLDDWGMARQFKPGYRVLFYGPPGTGKTLTAGLLGKHSGRDVYRIDLSMVISKYIGETEKNLSKLFDKAEHKDWILFFDEADALFGKRTGVRDAHDRYANQEISYLLQRIENYDGLAILASNLRENIDKAFLRRFQAVIHFPMPRPGERLQIWQRAFPQAVRIDESIDLPAIAGKYELSGADIMNVVHYCCLEAKAAGTGTITVEGLLAGIQRELQKLEQG